jgi:hypothetical protein
MNISDLHYLETAQSANIYGASWNERKKEREFEFEIETEVDLEDNVAYAEGNALARGYKTFTDAQTFTFTNDKTSYSNANSTSVTEK